jgi:hypothetical protein
LFLSFLSSSRIFLFVPFLTASSDPSVAGAGRIQARCALNYWEDSTHPSLLHPKSCGTCFTVFEVRFIQITLSYITPSLCRSSWYRIPFNTLKSTQPGVKTLPPPPL